jgi:hypothetical protein
MEYLMSTGNLLSPTGLDLMQVCRPSRGLCALFGSVFLVLSKYIRFPIACLPPQATGFSIVADKLNFLRCVVYHASADGRQALVH